uniref:Uncharacterized protein n=1 Tax=Rhizophora mucronata TaxID=61149 RepID=A0A2P2NNL7_RHIMU
MVVSIPACHVGDPGSIQATAKSLPQIPAIVFRRASFGVRVEKKNPPL